MIEVVLLFCESKSCDIKNERRKVNTLRLKENKEVFPAGEIELLKF